MAQVYYPKKTSTKLVEGAIAGLIGGVVYTVILFLFDALIPDRSWWTSPSQVGGIFTGATNFNTNSPDIGSLALGLVITFVVFILLGIGLINYITLFRTFNLQPILGGAAYGLLIWIVLSLIVLNAFTQGKSNLLALLVADVVAGALMAWWLSRQPTQGSAEDSPTSNAG